MNGGSGPAGQGWLPGAITLSAPRFLLAALVASMFVGTTPAYAAPEPLPIASVSPANGAVIPVRPPGLGESSWSLTSIPLLQNVSVIVTLTPATGTDGVRLSDTDLEQHSE